MCNSTWRHFPTLQAMKLDGLNIFSCRSHAETQRNAIPEICTSKLKILSYIVSVNSTYTVTTYFYVSGRRPWRPLLNRLSYPEKLQPIAEFSSPSSSSLNPAHLKSIRTSVIVLYLSFGKINKEQSLDAVPALINSQHQSICHIRDGKASSRGLFKSLGSGVRSRVYTNYLYNHNLALHWLRPCTYRRGAQAWYHMHPRSTVGL